MLAAKPKKSPLKLPVVIRYQKELNAVHQVVDAVQRLPEEEHLIPLEEQRKNRKAFEEHNDSSVAKKLNPSEERKKCFDLLHQLHKILEKKFSYPEQNFYSEAGFDVFSELFQFGLNCSSLFKELSNSEKVNKIKELLVDNSTRIKKLVIRFPYIILADIYSPRTICKFRSGIQFLFDLWGNLSSGDNTLRELFDPLNRKITFIDIGLKRWLQRPGNYVIDIPEGIPEGHSWWWWSSEIPAADSSLNVLKPQ
jgi:hypothetical protein